MLSADSLLIVPEGTISKTIGNANIVEQSLLVREADTTVTNKTCDPLDCRKLLNICLMSLVLALIPADVETFLFVDDCEHGWWMICSTLQRETDQAYCTLDTRTGWLGLPGTISGYTRLLYAMPNAPCFFMTTIFRVRVGSGMVAATLSTEHMRR